MGVQRRNIVHKGPRKYLRVARGRRRPAPPKERPAVVRLETPPPPKVPWELVDRSDALSRRAVAIASEIFGPRGRDAVLGWLFSRFPEFGQRGDDMVAHHVGLGSDEYYGAWVEFCRRLGLR